MVDTLSLEISVNLMFFLEIISKNFCFRLIILESLLIDEEISCFHRFFFLILK